MDAGMTTTAWRRKVLLAATLSVSIFLFPFLDILMQHRCKAVPAALITLIEFGNEKQRNNRLFVNLSFSLSNR